MRLLTFDKGGSPTPGVRKDDSVVDLSIAAPELPGDWPAIFAAQALARVAEAVAGAGRDARGPADGRRRGRSGPAASVGEAGLFVCQRTVQVW